MPTKSKQPLLPTLAVADLSTAHLTESDRRLIENPENKGISMTGEFGALVYLPLDENEITDWAGAGYSPAFLRIVRMAMHQGLTHLRFDADGTKVGRLPLFD